MHIFIHFIPTYIFEFLTGAGVRGCQFNAPTSGQSHSVRLQDAEQQVFMKTLAFFCALQTNGCLFDQTCGVIEEAEESKRDESTSTLYEILADVRSRSDTTSRCDGKLVLKMNSFGKAYIE